MLVGVSLGVRIGKLRVRHYNADQPDLLRNLFRLRDVEKLTFKAIAERLSAKGFVGARGAALSALCLFACYKQSASSEQSRYEHLIDSPTPKILNCQIVYQELDFERLYMSRHHQTTHAIILGLFLILCVPSYAQDSYVQNFQIKGAKLGMLSDKICTSPAYRHPTDKRIEDGIYESANLVLMHSSSCSVQHESFGGIKLFDPIHMLFVYDKLIQIKVQMKDVGEWEVGTLLASLTKQYGKPNHYPSKTEIAYIWKNGGNTLYMLVGGKLWGNGFVAVSLTDDKSYATYSAKSKSNSEVLEQQHTENSTKDMR